MALAIRAWWLEKGGDRVLLRAALTIFVKA
jgi:hypothetical protein